MKKKIKSVEIIERPGTDKHTIKYFSIYNPSKEDYEFLEGCCDYKTSESVMSEEGNGYMFNIKESVKVDVSNDLKLIDENLQLSPEKKAMLKKSLIENSEVLPSDIELYESSDVNPKLVSCFKKALEDGANMLHIQVRFSS